MGFFRVALGLLAQVLIAFYFGTTRQLDIYFIAAAFPSIAIGVVAAVSGPGMISGIAGLGGAPWRPGRPVSALFVCVLGVSLAMALGGMALGKELLGATTSLSGKELEAAGSLAGLMWVVAGLETMNGFLASLHGLRNRPFLPAALAGFPVIGTIGGAVFLSGPMGVKGLVAGWLVMDLLSLAALLAVLLRDRGFSPGTIDLAPWKPGRAVAAMLPFMALPAIDAYYASGLPEGSMSFLGYSTRAVMLTGVLVTGGISAVLLPRLSMGAEGDGSEMSIPGLRSSLKAALTVLAPVALFCYFYREPLVSALLQRGAFDARSVAGLSGVLPFYLLGLVAMCMSTLTSRAHASKGRYGRLCLVSVMLTAFYFAASGVLSERFSYRGIGVAYASYWCLSFLAGALTLGGSLIDRELLLFGARTAVNSVAAVALGYALSLHMPFHPLTVLALCSLFTVSLLVVLNADILKVREAAA